MLNKLSLKNILTSMLVISIVMFGGYKLNAQEGYFTNNTGGTYKARNTAVKTDANGLQHRGGIIRMKGADDTSGGFNGTNALGSSYATRISGTVIWAKDGNQKVQPRYYTNLGVAEPESATTGDHKRTFGVAEPGTIESYYVSGDFMRYENTLRANPITDAQALQFRGATNFTTLTTHGMSRGAVARLPIIEHLCLSDFWYDGGDTIAQKVLGSITKDMGGTSVPSTFEDNYYTFLNQWNEVSLTLGSYTQAQIFKQLAGTNDGRGPIGIGPVHIATGAPLRLLLADACDSAANDTTIIDSLEVDPCTPAWLAAHPGVDCEPDIPCVDCPPPCTGSGCDTADPCANGPALWAGADVIIRITGGMDYDGLDDGKVIPFCFYAGGSICRDVYTVGEEPTRVIYADGAVGIYPAHYGILQVDPLSYDLNLLGNVYIKGKRPYALDHHGSSNIVGSYKGTDTTYIVFEDVCADATYASCGEVVGWIYRNASTPDKLYTYHNATTKLALNGVPSTSSSTSIPYPTTGYNQWFGLMSIPGDFLVGNSISGAETMSKALKNSATDPINGFDESQYGYINRIWEVNFASANPAAAISEMYLGYLFKEVDPALLASWSTMRGYEAWDSDEYPATLVGEGGNPWEPTATAPTSGGGSFTGCNNLFVVEQTEPVTLTDEDAEDGEADDISKWSQIVIGNIPTVIKSVMNGRWSNPGTWGGVTPQKDDSVLVRHLVYTGIYDETDKNIQLLGKNPWSVNEHDLPGVYDDATDSYILAKSVVIQDSVTITKTNSKGVAPNPLGTAALIIGNHETQGTAPDVAALPTTNRYRIADKSGAQMAFDNVLTFVTIYNENSAGAVEDNPTLINWSSLKGTSADWKWGGLHVMGDITAGLWNGNVVTPSSGVNPAVPVINIYEYINSGKLVNEGVIEIGME